MKRAPSNPEAVIQAKILAACGALPGVLLLRNWVAKVPNPWGPGKLTAGLGEGTPDLVGAVAGRMIGLEVKVPGAQPDPHQAAVHRAWRALGVFVATVTSVDEAKAAIEAARATASSA